MVVEIRAEIRIGEFEQNGLIFPILQNVVIFGQVEHEVRHEIVNTRYLEEIRRIGADDRIRSAIYAGDETSFVGAVNSVIDVCQIELVIFFAELKRSMDTMKVFIEELGQETTLHSEIILSGFDEERWEVETEEELHKVAPEFLSGDRIQEWLLNEMDRILDEMERQNPQ